MKYQNSILLLLAQQEFFIFDSALRAVDKKIVFLYYPYTFVITGTWRNWYTRMS